MTAAIDEFKSIEPKEFIPPHIERINVRAGSNGVTAFCDLYVAGIRIFEIKVLSLGGKIEVIFPGRKRSVKCEGCKKKNEYDFRFCRHCGSPLSGEPPAHWAETEPGNSRYFVSSVHPTSQAARQFYVQAILDECQRRRLIF